MTTNYEWIKNMSFNEMLEWFTDVDDAPECLGCKMCSYCYKEKYPNGKFKFIQCCDDEMKCKEGIEYWLESEREEN